MTKKAIKSSDIQADGPDTKKSTPSTSPGQSSVDVEIVDAYQDVIKTVRISKSQAALLGFYLSACWRNRSCAECPSDVDCRKNKEAFGWE